MRGGTAGCYSSLEPVYTAEERQRRKAEAAAASAVQEDTACGNHSGVRRSVQRIPVHVGTASNSTLLYSVHIARSEEVIASTPIGHPHISF